MAILRIKDDKGNIIEIPAIKGDPGASSWNDLTDRPFGVEQSVETFVIDSVEGLESLTLFGVEWHKLNIPAEAIGSLQGVRVTACSPEQDIVEEDLLKIDDNYTIPGIDLYYYNTFHEYDTGFLEDFAWGNLAVVRSKNDYAAPIGVWYYTSDSSTPHTLTIHDVAIETITQLDEKFIPSTIARTKDIPSIDGLATKQYVNNAIANIPGGGGGSGGDAIVDVLELPTEGINTRCFYRLKMAYFVFQQRDQRENNFYCICVNSLPEVGKPVTTTMSDILAYYSILDDEAYGYITDELGAVAGIPAGWYTLNMLAPVFGATWGGIITDISDDPCDDSLRLLVTQEYYVYQDEWCKIPFAYERPPKYDIQWNGDMTDHVVLDMSLLGYEQGTYFVKVSDNVFTTEELIGWTYRIDNNDGSGYEERFVTDYDFDVMTYPGAFTINDWIVVLHDADALAAALGIPSGIYPNGVYFLLNLYGHVSRLASPAKITKIDGKYVEIDIEPIIDTLRDGDILHSVAFSGNYDELWNRPNLASVARSGNYNDLSNKPTIYSDVIRYDAVQVLTSNARSNVRSNIDVYSKSEVDTKIANAGTGADLSNYATKTELGTKLDIDKQAEVMNCSWGGGNQYIKLSLGKSYAAGQLLLIGESGISLTLIYTSYKWTAYRHLGRMPYKIYQSTDEPEVCYLQMSDITGSLSVRLKALGLYSVNISDITVTAVNTIPENAIEVLLLDFGAEHANIPGIFKLGNNRLSMNLYGSGSRPKFNDQDIAMSNDVYSKSQVDDKIASVASGGTIDLSGYAEKEWIESQGYITSIPAEYVTESELSAKSYAKTAELSAYAKTSDIPTVPTNIGAFANDVGYARTSDLDAYAKTSDVETMIANAIGAAIGGSY